MVPCTDRYGGGVCLLCADNVHVWIHYIDAIVHGERADGGSWQFTGFYGHPEPRQRHHSWDLLRTLSHQHASPKWLVVGDCNEILFSSKKSGGPVRPSWKMDDFQVALNDCGLQDLGYTEANFTWGNSLTRLWLDRVVASQEWVNTFLAKSVIHLPPSCSNHIPILVEARVTTLVSFPD